MLKNKTFNYELGFDINLIYQKGIEMSFEEIRALTYLKDFINTPEKNSYKPLKFDISMPTNKKIKAFKLFNQIKVYNKARTNNHAKNTTDKPPILCDESTDISFNEKLPIKWESIRKKLNLNSSNTSERPVTQEYDASQIPKTPTKLIYPQVRADENSINPYDRKLKKTIEEKIVKLYNLKQYTEYQPISINEDIKNNINPALGIQINDRFYGYQIALKIAEGGYGNIYLATDSNGKEVVLKVESSVTIWEFIMIKVIHNRIGKIKSKSIPTFTEADHLWLFNDYSVLLMKYYNDPTLLDLINKGKLVAEHIAAFYTVKLIESVVFLHRIGILHCDIKPDNILVNEKSKEIRIIDFGKSIDTIQFKKDTKFQVKYDKESICSMVLKDRSVNFELDFMGLADTIHAIIHASYLEVVEWDGAFHPTKSVRADWNSKLWNSLFYFLINTNVFCTTLEDSSIMLLSYAIRIKHAFKVA